MKYQITDCSGNVLGEGKTKDEAIQDTARNMSEDADFIAGQLDKPYSGEETTYCLKEIKE